MPYGPFAGKKKVAVVETVRVSVGSTVSMEIFWSNSKCFSPGKQLSANREASLT